MKNHIEITNRTLEKATRFSHARIKRWAVAFLKADPATGQHSGKVRTYTFEEACKIYLGGILVHTWRLSLKEAGVILDDILKWLDTKNWPISKFVEFRRRRLQPGLDSIPIYKKWWDSLIFYVRIGKNGNRYEVKEILEIKEVRKSEDENDPIWQVTYRPHDFGESANKIREHKRELALSEMVERLAYHLGNVS